MKRAPRETYFRGAEAPNRPDIPKASRRDKGVFPTRPRHHTGGSSLRPLSLFSPGDFPWWSDANWGIFSGRRNRLRPPKGACRNPLCTETTSCSTSSACLCSYHWPSPISPRWSFLFCVLHSSRIPAERPAGMGRPGLTFRYPSFAAGPFPGTREIFPDTSGVFPCLPSPQLA